MTPLLSNNVPHVLVLTSEVLHLCPYGQLKMKTPLWENADSPHL